MMDWPQYKWLLDQGVPSPVLVPLADLPLIRGFRGKDGWFDEDESGDGFLAFDEPDDTVFWCPKTGELATWHGRAFALGQDNIINAGTYAFDGYLATHADPLDWLRDGRRGIVVLNWRLAFDMLRDVPRIAVSEELLPTYRQHMKPSLPELAVLASERRLAA
jgi:hypothetical protein